MLYCQQCGAGNSDDARFCNQCGGKIARSGEPGGPLPAERHEALAETTMRGHGEAVAARAASEAEPDGSEGQLEREGVAGAAVERDPEPRDEAPPPRRSVPGGAEPSQGFDVSTMSLSAIGVRSPGKAWSLLIGLALLLVGLGALGTWLVMSTAGEGPPVAEASEGSSEGGELPPDEVEIGDAIPEGAEPPGDVVTGTPRPSEARAGTTRSGGTRGSSSSSRSGASQSGGERTSGAERGSQTGGGGSTGGSRGGESTGGSSGGGSSAGGSRSGSGSGSSGSGSSSGSNSSGSNTSGSTGGGSEPDWEAMAEEDERDFEMDEYAGRVRRVVRQYYARRAQGCFEHETRNERSVRGTVVIGFDIQSDGTIDNPEVVRNTTGIDTLGRCLARQVGSWRLPPPPESPLAMQMPFSR